MTLESVEAGIDAENGDPNRHVFNHSGIYVHAADVARIEELGLSDGSPCSICGWAFNEHGGQTVAEHAQAAADAAQEEAPLPAPACVCGHVEDEHDVAEGSSWPCSLEECDCLGWEPIEEEAPAEPNEQLTAQEPAAGSQLGLPGIQLPRLWPDFEGHRVTAIGVGISGSLTLRAGDEFHEALAQKLRHLGGALILTLELRIESAGHAVIRDRKTGADIGRTGISKVSIRRLVDEAEWWKALNEYEVRQDATLRRIDELLEHWLPPEPGDIEALDADELRQWLQEAATNAQAHLTEIRELLVHGEEVIAQRAAAAAELDFDRIGPLVSCGVCSHPKQDHDGLAGNCNALFSVETGEGEPVADICKCSTFRLMASEEEISEIEDWSSPEPDSRPVCGKVHRGHLSACPFPADECSLPSTEEAPE